MQTDFSAIMSHIQRVSLSVNGMLDHLEKRYLNKVRFQTSSSTEGLRRIMRSCTNYRHNIMNSNSRICLTK